MDMNLEQFIAGELANIAGFKKFYLNAVQKFPDHFGLCQTEELWREELLSYIECRSFNVACLECDPDTCKLVAERVSDSGT